MLKILLGLGLSTLSLSVLQQSTGHAAEMAPLRKLVAGYLVKTLQPASLAYKKFMPSVRNFSIRRPVVEQEFTVKELKRLAAELNRSVSNMIITSTKKEDCIDCSAIKADIVSEVEIKDRSNHLDLLQPIKKTVISDRDILAPNSNKTVGELADLISTNDLACLSYDYKYLDAPIRRICTITKYLETKFGKAVFQSEDFISSDSRRVLDGDFEELELAEIRDANISKELAIQTVKKLKGCLEYQRKGN